MNHKRRNARHSSRRSSCWWYPLLRCWSTLKGLGKSLCRYSGSSVFLYYCLYALCTFFKLLLGGLTVYCRKGCITGTRYLVQPNYHYTERIFWAICLIFSILLGLAVIWQYLNTYTDNVFRVVVEDRDVNEPLQFPSVGLCEIGDLTNYNDELLNFYNNITSAYPLLVADTVDKDLLNILRLMIYPSLHEPDKLTGLFNSSHRAIYKDIFRQIDFEKLAKEVRMSCKQFFDECIWNDKHFDCCTYFRELKTMTGNCFLINSLQTASGPNMNLTVTKLLEKPSIYISFRRNAKTFLLNPNALPEQVTSYGNNDIYELGVRHIEFTHRPMITDAALFDYNLNVTNCYEGKEEYMDWNKLVHFTYKYASYSSCICDCVRYIQYRDCGCISYIFNKGIDVKYCDLEGYLCLEKKSLFHVKDLHELKDTICRKCLQACTSDVNTVINYDIKFIPGATRSSRYTLLSFPRKRLHRQVIRGDLDVLVSLGGILSLFIGISAVGILEFLFIVIRAMIRTEI